MVMRMLTFFPNDIMHIKLCIMLLGTLPLLWKITINYIVLLLSTRYDSDEQGELCIYHL